MLFLSSPLVLLAILLSVSAAPHCDLKPPKEPVVDTRSGSSSSGNEANTTDSFLAAAWYPGWLGDVSPPENISWTKYNMVTFAFALTTSNVKELLLDAKSQEILPRFVAEARKYDVKALVSIGGWTGSQYFSNHVATKENRTAFVKTVTDLINEHELDGVDFDWEYPNKQGIGCNAISPDDSANFLLYLQALRKEVGKDKVISAAVGPAPFNGPTDEPMSDVSAFSKVLDHIVIMAYDIWGSWSPDGTVGPNAPLNDSCEPNQTRRQGSAEAAVATWKAAQFPANQIALGVAGYGRSYHVDAASAFVSGGQLAPYPTFDKSQQPPGDGTDGGEETDTCGNRVPVGGVFTFGGLVEGGFLNADGTPANEIDYRFDDCSQTPYVYNQTSQVMVSFDDAKSFAAKGKFIQDNELYGFAMWHSAGDLNDALINSISKTMGLVEECPAP